MSIRERAYKRNCLIATSALPLAYLNMPKAACSTIKNILYYLETGSWFSDPLGIHRHIQQGSTLLRGSALARHLDQNTLQRPYITFTFVRHPGKRAYSGFINKIWFIHPYSFQRIRCFLQDSRSMVVPGAAEEASLSVVRSAFSLISYWTTWQARPPSHQTTTGHRNTARFVILGQQTTSLLWAV